MKLHYSKILLFLLPLNILLTSYHEHNKNKPSITPHHTQTNRSLCESDTESSIYDNDEEINSVKEIFERQTSQRFEEYQERMKEKRQKRKEQRDKNIQKIIQKDKMEKNLAEKIEKGCLMCGCGLGSVAGSVGLFGGIAINIWKNVALDVGIKEAIKAAAAEISASANAAGAAEIMKLIKSKFVVSTLGNKTLKSFINPNTYTQVTSIYEAVSNQYLQTCANDSLGKGFLPFADGNRDIPFCNSVWEQTQAVSQPKMGISFTDGIRTAVETMVADAKEPAKAAAEAARESAINAIKARETGLINTIFMSKQTAIIASVVAILIIVLVMIIIYLVLRYRRKKKMKKKAQYTKLLNE
ncbi:PIR protein [Plasmodium reichenowi]|uniref:PIR protein n=1 Tax=Plasmodium reichenowi TaxID=5854 RepID=A0A2P9DRU4_PLARE|nr:PIR protein [Plasmodium reichenowi]